MSQISVQPQIHLFPWKEKPVAGECLPIYSHHVWLLGEGNVSSSSSVQLKSAPCNGTASRGRCLPCCSSLWGSRRSCIPPGTGVCAPLAPSPCSPLRTDEGRSPRAELLHPQSCGYRTLSFLRAAQLPDNPGVFKYSECFCPGPVFPRGSNSWILFLHLSFLPMHPTN